jgi:glutamate synthase (NADPH/NADH) small chain
VVVVGAGNTAIDAANAARRMGADRVTIVYRRTESDMPAFGFEYEHAKQEGVVFEWLAQPVAIHTDAASGRIASLECVRSGSNFHLPCDMVIPAIGQAPLGSFLERNRSPKIYSGGDCVNGGREVVDAVADGKRAAMAIASSFEATYA